MKYVCCQMATIGVKVNKQFYTLQVFAKMTAIVIIVATGLKIKVDINHKSTLIFNPVARPMRLSTLGYTISLCSHLEQKTWRVYIIFTNLSHQKIEQFVTPFAGTPIVAIWQHTYFRHHNIYQKVLKYSEIKLN